MSRTKELVMLALLATLLFIQEEVLVFLPNIQLTVFLLILYSKNLGCLKTLGIIVIYAFLDNVYMASFHLIYTPFMFMGWALIPLLLDTVFKKAESTFRLSLLAIVFAFLYSWMYVIANVWIMGMDWKLYLLSDIPFELLFAASSFLTTLWLYEPCCKVFRSMSK